MIQLRDYQQAAVDAIVPALSEGQSTLVSACVGAGKTMIQAEFIRRMMELAPGSRFISLVHTRELVDQNAKAMMRVWPGAPIGINSAALGRRDTRHPILFASIQSVAKHARLIGHIDVAMVDEAHLIPIKDTSFYQVFLGALKEINPDLRLVGLSGTPFRLDSGWLHRGRHAMFDSMCFDISIPELISRGFLVPPISRATDTHFDVSGIKVRGGDYVASDLQERVNDDAVTRAAVAEMVTIGREQGRRSWIAFCAGVDHAYAVRDEIRRHGVTCETVEGALDGGVRAGILAAYKVGQVQCLTNVNVLSIGFDHQGVDLLAMMRPTKSAGLYIQQVGRGLRCLGPNVEASIAAGKKNCLVLDFAGLVSSLGPVDLPMVTDGSSEKATISPAPTRICDHCQTINAISARECINCSEEFERESSTAKLAPTASVLPILSTVGGDWYDVSDVKTYRHVKRNVENPIPSLRVTYGCGLAAYNEWICFEHPLGSFPQTKSKTWWRDRGGLEPVPIAVNEAIKRFNELRPVEAIRVIRDGQYDRVVNVRFGEADVDFLSGVA